MNYYAVQVRTGQEDAYIKRTEICLKERSDRQSFYFPKRQLSIRKQGINKQTLLPIFPGYVFIAIDKIDSELINIMRKNPGFQRFLKNTNEITELKGKDLSILMHFLSFGDIINESKVYFDENDHIVVTSGPLKGLEGHIVKVDKRKRRAKIRIEFSEQNTLLDLAFELLEEQNEPSK